ncbi:MAG: hypothetical protein V3V99_03010 [candidate division Zixibacteria bacterium]
MNKDLENKLSSYPNVKFMLDGLPKDIWSLFLPEDLDKLYILESRIVVFKKKEMERERVMSIQRVCDFPLHPNESLAEVQARARIQGKKNDKKFRRRGLDNDRDYL